MSHPTKPHVFPGTKSSGSAPLDPLQVVEGGPARHLRPPTLPFQDAVDAVDELARNCRRLADVVEATSRRRDVRDKRAKILLTVLGTRCPVKAIPRVSWYVPGAAARLGAEGISRAWEDRWGEVAPSVRTIRSHLGALEMACAIVRSPGDWLPQMRDPEHPERRPRYPETIHVLETHEAATWWATVGRQRIEENVDCRYHPTRWRMLFARWRSEVAATVHQGELFDGRGAATIDMAPPAQPSSSKGRRPRGLPRAPKEATAGALEAADAIAATCRRVDVSTLDIMGTLAAAGAHLKGRMSWALAADPRRLRGAACMLVVALLRGDPIRNRAGWMVRAFRHASLEELRGAVEAVASLEPRA